MLLIIEIMLTVAAWKKGWRGWALLPVAICFATAFLLGAAAGANGTSPDDFVGIGLVLDVLLVVVLGVMIAKAPAVKEVNTKGSIPAETQVAEDTIREKVA